MDPLVSDFLGGIQSKTLQEEMQGDSSALPSLGDPLSSNFDSCSADATTDGFEGGALSEAPTESSSGLEVESSFSGSIGHLDEHELLEMIHNGELEYSIEKDPNFINEQVENESIEFLIESSMPLPISPEHSSPTKKRSAENDAEMEQAQMAEKKPKLEETSNLDPPSSSIHSTSGVTDTQMPSKSDAAEIVPIPIEETPKLHIIEKSSVTPSKANSRNRQPYANLPPSSIMTRTRSMASLGASGHEIVVPEHSHTLPKWMPRAPIKEIEIPVWTIRETYEEEESLRTEFQQRKSKPSDPASASSSSILDIEKRFMNLINKGSVQNNQPQVAVGDGKSIKPMLSPSKVESDSEEEIGGEEYYAERHYKYEIIERLRWEIGPGSDRFKKEDRNMTVDEFRLHELWTTYFGARNGTLLPESMWAQNIVHVRPKPIRKERVPASRNGSPAPKSTPKAPPIALPKGFVFKVKSTNGTAVIRTLPSHASQSLPTTPARSIHTPHKVTSLPKAPLTHPKPVMKKAGGMPNFVPPLPRPPTFIVKPHVTLAHAPPPPVAAAPAKAPSRLIVKFGSKSFGTTPAPDRPSPILPSHPPPQ